MHKDELKKYLPLFIALGIALIAAIYYFGSGHSSLDNNIRDLEKSSTVENVQTKDDNTIIVNCKNGESYEIYYPPGQTSYDNLVYDKCGSEGAVSVSQQVQ